MKIPVARHCYAVKHRKEPSDRAESHFKRWLKRIIKDPHLFLNTCKALGEYSSLHYSKQITCTGNNSKLSHSLTAVFYHEEILPIKYSTDLKALSCTRKIHSIHHAGKSGVVEVPNMSFCCPFCMYGIGECLFKQYANKWQMCSVQGHTKSELQVAKNIVHDNYSMKLSDKKVM